MAQPTLSSNNPFRRNGAGASTPAAAPPPFALDALDSPSAAAPSPSSSEHFRSQLQALSQPAHPPPATSFQKPKVVKKVRVQSPPPSSPESAGAPDSYQRSNRYDKYSDTSEDEEDEVNPFALPQAPSRNEEPQPPDDRLPSTLQRAPPNPFQRTLQDLELGSDGAQQNLETPAGSRAALDVDAFQRLLLTGRAGGPEASTSVQTQPAQGLSRGGDGANQTDTSSLSRQSISGASAHPSTQDTPRTSHEISDRDADDDRHGLIGGSRPKPQTPTTLRKKPPPPSSRHGKLIKPQPVKDRVEGAPTASSGSSTSQTPREPTTPLPSPSLQEPAKPLEANKPLPVVPPNEADEKTDGVLSHDGAGTVQEPEEMSVAETISVPRPPTPPKASHSIPTSPQPKKPPPPPRRQPHGRSESRASVQVTAASPTSAHHPEDRDLTARRSSQDSTRSRSSSLRVSIHAPAPPPPRRPTHHTRPSNSFVSPSSVSFSSVTPSGSERSPSELPEFSPLPTPSIAAEMSATETPVSSTPGHSTPHLKQFPPPPPPARNASTRPKRTPSVHSIEAPSRRMSNHAGLPPPPPPRARGSSKGSVDGVVVGTKLGVDPARILEGTFAEEPENRAAEEPGASTDILADLTALQREVDALRAKAEKGA